MTTAINAILEAIKSIFIGYIEICLKFMFADMDKGVLIVTGMSCFGPTTIFPEIMEMIRDISETVLLPIASIIISFVLSYDLISIVIDKNNMHEFDTSIFIRFFIKAVVSVVLLTKCFDISLAIFDVGSHVAAQAGLVLTGKASMTLDNGLVTTYINTLSKMNLPELIYSAIYISLDTLIFKVMAILIAVIAYGRIIEAYLLVSVAPITFATLGNKEWGHIGTNYLKSLCAIAFQGFLMLVCVEIYSALLLSITDTEELPTVVTFMAIFGIVLCFSLFKTSSLSKQIFTAH